MQTEDLSPVQLTHLGGSGPFVFVCEHASNRIPLEYNNLGIAEDVQQSHAGWDIGALELSQRLSYQFDSPLIASTVSRLVYDCNRAPESDTAIVTRSENDTIPGNLTLSIDQRKHRVDTIYQPFADLLSSLLENRRSKNIDTILVTMHSFTPVMRGQARAVEIGLLHDTDSRFVDDMLRIAQHIESYKIERNQPYGPDDDVTHTLTTHAMPHQLLNVMIEVRNDLLLDDESIAGISALLYKLLNDALKLHVPKSSEDNSAESHEGKV